jgi:hypothetical protein
MTHTKPWSCCAYDARTRAVIGLLIYPSVMYVFGRYGNRWLLSHLVTRGWVHA